jgi:hypothetical protein
MEEARERVNCALNEICDELRYLGDVSYAILPHDIAHALGDFKKAVLSSVRSAIDWEIDWIDERVTGGDRLREGWRKACEREAPSDAGGPVS